MKRHKTGAFQIVAAKAARNDAFREHEFYRKKLLTFPSLRAVGEAIRKNDTIRWRLYIEEAIGGEEKRIKGGSGKNKLKLIETMNPDWRDLWEEIMEW